MGINDFTYLGQAYGSGDYGNCSYNTSSSCSTTSGSGGTSGSPLANTGFMIAIVVTIACIIILVAILVRWWRRPRKAAQKTAEPVSTDANQNQDDKKL